MAKDLHNKYFVNEDIRGKMLLVIGPNGENFGEMVKEKALTLAFQHKLDLVQVGEKNNLTVARIVDFGKLLYTKKKQLSDSKKKQKIIQVKEIKIRPNIDEQDYKTKINRADEFLKDGKRVKFTLQVKGREITMFDNLGNKMFSRIFNDLQEKSAGNLFEERESRMGMSWSRIYVIKEK